VTVDHEITVDGVDATQVCVALLFRDNEFPGVRHLYRPAHLRAWRLVLHIARTRMGPGAAREHASGVTAELSYEFAFGTYEDALRMVGTGTVRGSPARR